MVTKASTRGRSRINKRELQQWFAGYFLISPFLFMLLVFLILAIGMAIYYSFTRYDILSPAEFRGFANYTKILCLEPDRCDDLFLSQALPNTFLYVLGVVPAQTALALVLAFAVDRITRFKGVLRTLFYIPSVTSSVVISIIFIWLFSPDGIVNQIIGPSVMAVLGKVLGMEYSGTGINWLFSTKTALPTIMLVNIWSTAATLMLIFTAALQNIPTTLYEASSIDGATQRQQFQYVTLPMLTPVIFFAVATGIIGAFQVFDQIAIITQGGPLGATTTMVYLTYQNAFKQSTPQMGYASAMAMVLSVIIIAVTIFTRRLLDRDVTQ
jgi:multiple sugar transport system permease protein